MGSRVRAAARIGAGLAAIAGLWFGATASGASASSNPSSVESAWWNVAVPGPVAVPSPTTSSDQLQVGEGATGPLSYAAVRFQLPGNVEPVGATVALRLDMAQTGTVGTPLVAACVTTGSWTPGGDQPDSAAPGYYCGGGKESVGIVSGSSETWSLSSAFLAAGSQQTYDIALVPDPGTSTPFSVDYSQPTSSSVLVNGSPAPTGTPGGDTGSTGQPASTSIGVTPGIGAFEPLPQSPIATPAVNIPAVVPSGGVSAPALAPGPASPSSGVGAPGGLPHGPKAAVRTGAPASNSTRARRIMAAAVLVGLGAALYLISRRPARAPRLIGAFASTAATAPPARMGGIGRFARPRAGPPPRLS